jgi:hypothetical protein
MKNTKSFLGLAALLPTIIALVLTGCPNSNGGGGDITYTATPVITAQPVGASYAQDDIATALAITATTNDGGALTYQWYRNNTNSNSGGTAITDRYMYYGRSMYYTPPTTVVGTVYYYVVVTNTNNSVSGAQTASVTSNTAAIIVDIPISLDITIGYNNGTITISGSEGTNTISRTGADGTPTSLTLSASGYTGITWYVNGENKGTDESLVLDAADYEAKIHSVTFTGWQNGSYLSSGPIPFTVK